MIVTFYSYHAPVPSWLLTLANRIVGRVNRSRRGYYHSTVSFIVDGKEWVFEAHAPVLEKRLRDEREDNADGIEFEVDDVLGMQVFESCLEDVGTPYDFLMVYFGFLFRMSSERRWSKNRLFCSEHSNKKAVELNILPAGSVEPFKVHPSLNHWLLETAKHNRKENS